MDASDPVPVTDPTPDTRPAADKSPRRVLGVPRDGFSARPWPWFQGFRPAAAFDIIPMLSVAEFREKAPAEADESFKQVIPYVILTHERSLFTYRRAGSEGRLDGKVSIGVGGHVEADDYDMARGTLAAAHRDWDGPDLMMRTVGTAMFRELDEELALPEIRSGPAIVGLINDDSDPVGRVHLGIVYHAELASPAVRPGPDGEITGGKFWPASSLIEWAGMQPDVFEGWTRAAIEGWAKPWAAKG